MARRFDLVAEVTHEVVADVIAVWAEGDDALGDSSTWCCSATSSRSTWPAGRAMDPGPVPAIGEMEAALR